MKGCHRVGKNGVSRNGKMPRRKKNWCPICREYQTKKHVETYHS